MRSSSSIASLVLLLTSGASLVSMISTLRIDSMVHGDLYRYGLQFSYAWAQPYWTMTTLVFGVGWFNIITSIAFQFYVLLYGRRETVKPQKGLTQPQPQLWPQFPLAAVEEKPQAEAKSAEIVEENIEQAAAQAQAAEPIEESSESPPQETEATTQEQPQEAAQPQEVEAQREQEEQQPQESQTATEETSSPAAESEQTTSQPAQKDEEPPILIGVPEENPQTATETPPQQVQTN